MTKRFTAFLLVLALILVAASGIAVMSDAFAAETKIAVIADIHIQSEEYYTAENFEYYLGQNKMEHLSEAVFNTVVDEILADKKIETVLIAGDLVDKSDKKSHIAGAKIMRRLTAAGRKVFVINGNHDVELSAGASSTDTFFMENYEEFGYGDAISIHSESLSYAADFGEKYRLFAIDNNEYYSERAGKIKTLYNSGIHAWLETQLDKAVEDGKIPVAMIHQPVLPFMFDIIHSSLGIESGEKIMELLSKYGAEYIFTGHQHAQSVTEYAAKNGRKLYEVMTSSPVYFAPNYRTVSFRESKTVIKSHAITSVSGKYITDLLPKAARDLAESDYGKYMHDVLDPILKDTVLGVVKGVGGSNEKLGYLIENSVVKILEMPLYGEGDTVSRLLSPFGVKLPVVAGAETLLDLVPDVLEKAVGGDQNMSFEDPEIQLIVNCIKGIFVLMQEASESDMFSSSMNLDLVRLFEKGELEIISGGLIRFAGDLIGDISLGGFSIDIGGLKGISFLKPILIPLLDNFSKGLGTAVGECVHDTYLDFDMLIEDAVFGTVLFDVMNDKPPRNGNLIIPVRK